MTDSVTFERNNMIKLIAKKDKNMSNGMRDTSRTPLTESEIKYVKSEIERIQVDKKTKNEIEKLVAGEVIEKEIHQELTYDEIDNSIENIWSVLFTTGYLTQDKKVKNGVFSLKIPNEEIRTVYKRQIREWLNTSLLKDISKLHMLWKDFQEGNSEAIEDYKAGIVVELKYSATYEGMDKACEEAILQIKDKRYDAYLRNEQRNDILIYGMAFCKKRCKVVAEKLNQAQL